MKLKRAIISVSDKTGIVELAKGLKNAGIEIISTGGTYKVLKEAGIDVAYISEVTNFPEILDGRVKTLHPAVHGGILARRDDPKHIEELRTQGIETVDMIVVNLYPFEATIEKADVTLEEAIENIDIGGPTMIRSAAKNWSDVAVVTNPDMYGPVLKELEGGGISDETRLKLSLEAFKHTSRYDSVIYNYLAEQVEDGKIDFADRYFIDLQKVQDLRYGENPHQNAAFYKEHRLTEPSIASALQLGGKELSFNNINDGDAALEMAKDFDELAVVAVKHTNPCGLATGKTVLDAYKKTYESDPVSIFGGIVAVNRIIDRETAEEISKIFVEIVIAPDYEDEALDILKTRESLRILKVPGLGEKRAEKRLMLKQVTGGMLIQDADLASYDPDNLKVVTQKAPTDEEMKDLLFSWKVCKHVKSNAIVAVKNLGTVGVGAGQMNRINAARLGFEQAGDKIKGAVLASDAFFPFPDVVKAAEEVGISAIIQPGGSIRDNESIEAADKAGIAMVFTGMRHFRHS